MRVAVPVVVPVVVRRVLRGVIPHRVIMAVVVRVLVADARRRGCTLALLAAGDDAVARVYEHVGFTRSGTCGAAEPG